PAEYDYQSDRDYVCLSGTHAGEPGEYAGACLQRAAPAGPGGAWGFARESLPAGARARHAGLEGESRFSPAGAGGQGNYGPGSSEADRASLRVVAAVEERVQNIGSRVRDCGQVFPSAEC